MMLNSNIIYVHAQIRVGFYSSSCPRAEAIIRSTVNTHFQSDPTISPGLLRMNIHDCFVKGCDASILINGTSTEKTAAPNLLLRGYEVIDDPKTQLEASCPGVVSCDDILAIAARDSVVVSGGVRWSVPTGRLDGRVSLASDPLNLPAFTDSIEVQIQKFDAKVLYNYNGTGAADPTINPSFLTTLGNLCPDNSDGSLRITMDTGSETRFYQSYYTNLRNGRGFGRSMVKMSNIEVKTGAQGQIRRICSAIN
ncbi:hypothetical protein MKX03_005502 [Papaver bracteatum]|nr:hypothetical protein MKX03_005502 [Papaver bracteatum]